MTTVHLESGTGRGCWGVVGLLALLVFKYRIQTAKCHEVKFRSSTQETAATRRFPDPVKMDRERA